MALNYFTAAPAAAPAFLNMHVVSTNFAIVTSETVYIQ